MELLVLKTLLSTVPSISLQIHGDCLLQIVRTCYNIYLGSKNILNQMTGELSVLSLFRFHLHCPVVVLVFCAMGLAMLDVNFDEEVYLNVLAFCIW
ncbi:putative mon2, dimerization and cyclophilin-binding domain-containing protein [Rosa chinensis]|uniref:Putative mon2, dimerization and cyclophilin-binding domain-containing protein n=1 Tax=Rosa chinensis TaxID=74649 RepID=A0A2P6RC67_ROSCH|nr:putative mon2, dimerization and cyclophilin-binding domain-containing protein [Rosa chinensis]